MALAVSNLIYGNTILHEQDPACTVHERVLYMPVAGQDPQAHRSYGLYQSDGQLIEAAGRFRGPGRERAGPMPFCTQPQAGLPSQAGTFFYLGLFTTHYGHFLLDTLCRLWAWPAWRASGAKLLYHDIPAPQRLFSLPFSRTILAACGLTPDDFVRFDEPVRLARVIVPAPAIEELNYVHRAYARLFNRIGGQICAGLPPPVSDVPVYLTKQHLPSGISHFVNEARFTAALARAGVEIIAPERLSFAEQVALFRTRRMVTGVIGSAFHTSLFTPACRLLVLNYEQTIWSNQLLVDRANGNQSRYVYDPQAGPNLGGDAAFQNNFRLADPEGAASAFLRLLGRSPPPAAKPSPAPATPPPVKRTGMKWYFALSAATLASPEHDWPSLIRAALRSARANTSLRPHLLWDGPATHEFIDELRGHGVRIIRHSVSFLPELARHNPDPVWLAVAAGAFLRVDIPAIETEDEFVLYTDADVIFLHDVVPAMHAVRPRMFAACTEFTFSDDLNSGVMLLNIPALRESYPDFLAFIRANLHRGLDQDMYRAFYAGKWEAMPPEFNWKPYWGVNERAMLLHWHGIKPIAVARLLGNPAARSIPDLQRLVDMNPPAYRHYLEVYDMLNAKLSTPPKTCAAVLVVKDEASDILGWLAWYKLLGFDALIVYDDESTDGTREIVAAAAQHFDIRLANTQGPRGVPYEFRQDESYKHALETYGDEFAWLGFFDADEYLWLEDDAGIRSFLGRFPQADEVAVNWCNFGSSGHALKPSQPAPLAYTWHGSARQTINRHVKCLVRPRAVGPRWLGVHCFDVPADRAVLANGAPAVWSETPGIITQDPDWSAARLMHYQCRSMEHFVERLKKRPFLLTIPKLWPSSDFREEEFLKPQALASRLDAALAELAGRAPPPGAAPPTRAGNISRGKPATQSSHCTWSFAPTLEADAAGAVNGVLDGTRKFHTDFEDNPWWQVDLGSIATITEIHIHNTADPTRERFRDFTLAVSIDGESWVALAEKADGAVVTQPYIWAGPGTAWARFVRVTLLGHNFLHLAQVEVFGRMP